MGLRDPFSAASHLLAAVWAAYATLVLIRLCPPGIAGRAAAAAYGLSMTALYLASGAYHAAPSPPAGSADTIRLLHAADRSAIFLLIAGTNTPVIVTLLPSPWRGLWLGAMWGLAAVGVAAVWAFPGTAYGVLVWLYVAMGWLGGGPIVRYYRAVGWRGMNWALLGGVLYTAGAVCDLLRWPVLLDEPVRVGPHDVFHMAVVAASAAFFVFIARHVIPLAAPGPRSSV